jgi:predicted RNA-binding protein YlqC (UPF0109 family)
LSRLRVGSGEEERIISVSGRSRREIRALIGVEFGHQKRYYAPFMGYKFIAYLCP